MQNGFMRRIAVLLKGFDFLGFHCCPTGMTVSEASLSRREQKIARLYEQGASKEHVGAYLWRWLGWVGVGVMMGSVWGCVGDFKYVRSGCQESEYVLITFLDKKMGVSGDRLNNAKRFEEKGMSGIHVCGSNDVGAVKGHILEPARVNIIDNVVEGVLLGGGAGKPAYVPPKSIREYNVELSCKGRESCMVVLTEKGLWIFYRKSEDEYVELMGKVKNDCCTGSDDMVPFK